MPAIAIPARQHRVDYDVAMEVASHEAIIRQTYRDSEGVNTWSVGLTSYTGHNVDRYIGKPQPLQHCLNIYVWALTRYAEQVKEAFGNTKLTKAQFAAAVSFHWNTGAIKKATWVKRFKAGDIAGAKEAFMWYLKPPSIKKRRQKEFDLFFKGKWSNDGKMAEYTRLTSKRTPVWSSRRTIDVSKQLRAAFAATEMPDPVDHEPQPDADVITPTLSPPDQDSTVPAAGGIGAILLALGAILNHLLGG
jgi:lysozyme